MRSPSERISPIGAKYCSPLGSRPRGQGLRRSATSHQALAVPGRRNPRRGGVPPARAASVDAIGPVMISTAEPNFRRTAERDITPPHNRHCVFFACTSGIPMPRRRRPRASKRSPRCLGRRDRGRGKGVASGSTTPAIALRALRSPGRSSPDDRSGERGTARCRREAIARRLPPGPPTPLVHRRVEAVVRQPRQDN
jgi:hypothetical protein